MTKIRRKILTYFVTFDTQLHEFISVLSILEGLDTEQLLQLQIANSYIMFSTNVRLEAWSGERSFFVGYHRGNL